jgi:hypothetical protein
MADGVSLDAGAGGDTIAADDLGAAGKVQWVKLRDGTDGGSQTIASGGGTEAASLRVTVASDSTGVLSVDDNGSTLSVDDGAGSLTVDNAVISVVGGGTEAAAQRVTIASDSTGVLSVDDNGGSLTVDGTVELGATSLAALESVTVVDGGSSLTVDNAALSVTGGGVEASAIRVTVASDSTGVLSVDDNGSSLTVDGTVTATQGVASTATLANVSSSATSVTLAASNGSRKALTIHNDSSAVLYVKFGTTASTSSFTVKMAAGDYYEVPAPVYTGRIDGIWASADGAARTTEMT